MIELRKTKPALGDEPFDFAAYDGAVEAYAGMRPSRPAVLAALKVLRRRSPQHGMALLRIFLRKVEAGDWPVGEVYQAPEFVDEHGRRELQPSNLVLRADGVIRHGYRDCSECDGTGWHHFEYPGGTTTASRCKECSAAYAAFLREQERKRAKAARSSRSRAEPEEGW